MTRRPWSLLGGALAAALLVGGLAAVAPAQICTPTARTLVVLLTGTTRLQMTSRKAIRTVTNPKEGVLQIRTVDRDPATLLLVGLQPGVTRLDLEDVDGGRESLEVYVQVDTDYVTAQLRRAVPLANIQVIPSGVNTVVLSGYVNRAEDINVATAIAASAGFQPINGLRVSGVQQVQLDVVLARVARDKTRAFGFNFLQNSRYQFLGSTVGNVIPPPALVGAGASVGPTRFGGALSSPTGNANLFGGIIGPDGGFLGFLQALKDEGLAKVLAQPRVVTLSGNPASFLDGGEQAIPIPAGLGQVGVQFEEFGTRLNVLPIVLGNGKIHLEVEPEVSILTNTGSVTLFAGGQPVQGRQTQRIHTTVEMESGQTFVIGGLIQRQTEANTIKIPVLGELPFVGTLFSTKVFAESETELVVMVTPYLIDAQSCDQVAKILPGQETRSPDDFELFLEGILEAPRGPREVFHGNRYVPAYRNGPTAALFPCAGKHGPGGAAPGNGGCAPAGAPALGPQKAPPPMPPAPAAEGAVKVGPPAPVTPTAAPGEAGKVEPAAEGAKAAAPPADLDREGGGDNP